MTPKQQKLLKYIKEYYGIHKVPPTFTEMGEYMDTYRQNIEATVKSLIKQGYLKKIRHGVIIHTSKKIPVDTVS